MPEPNSATSDEALERARSGDYSQIFNELVFRSLQPISLGLWVMYSIFFVAGFFDDHSSEVRRIIVSTDAAAAVIFVMLYVACRKDLIAARWINPIGLGIAIIATANTLIAYEYAGDRFYLTYVPMIIVSYGALLLSLRWLLVNTALVIACLVTVVANDLPFELLVRYSPALIGATVLAAIILIVRRRGIIAAQRALLAAKDELESRQAVEVQLAHSQRLDSLGKLVSGIAHEFNNLLMVIIGYADQLLIDTSPDAPETADVRAIRDAGKRAAALSAKLLAFSRQQVMKPRTVAINELVTNARPLIERSISGDVELHIDLDAAAGLVSVDPLQMEQVLLNLALNARDAMKAAGGELTISTAGGEAVEIRVSDTGEGMSDEVAERAFEPFFTTKPQGSGTGLGLATVYGIVTQSGGRIDLQSAPGEGTTFRILLPHVEAAMDAVSGDEDADRPAPQTLTGTVLLVDDEPGVRSVVRMSLEQLGCRVIDAADGAAALEAAAGESFDIVLTDIVMPGMSGIELVQELRRRGYEQAAIFMSGHGAEAEGEAAAFGPFLRKPFPRKALVAAIAELQGARSG